MKAEVFEPHSRFGGEVYCTRSNRPVEPRGGAVPGELTGR